LPVARVVSTPRRQAVGGGGHTELLGHALVSWPYREWSGCRRAGEREQYLRGKLAHCVQTPSHTHKQYEKLI